MQSVFKLINEFCLNLFLETTEVEFCKGFFFSYKAIMNVDIRLRHLFYGCRHLIHVFLIIVTDVTFELKHYECRHPVHIFELFITNVNFKLHYYGCRHPVKAFELRMSTTGFFFCNCWLIVF